MADERSHPGRDGEGGAGPGGGRHGGGPDPETELRRHALGMFRAALQAVDPERLVRGALEAEPLPDPGSGRLLVAAVGKAAPAMARGAAGALSRRADRGVVLTVPGTGGSAARPSNIEVHEGGHPLPDEAGVRGARAVLELVADAGEGDLVLLLLSGGGSALLTLPSAGVGLDDLRSVTAALLEAGAAIEELNAVRKHLEVLKGGGLAREAAPARIRALVLSDVVGDPLHVIASGPASPDPTTFARALAVLERHELDESVAPSVWRRLRAGRRGEVPETPDEDDPVFDGVEVRVVGNAETAARAAAEEASARGFPAQVVTTGMTGEAREVGADIAARLLELGPPACRVWAGETTVTVRGPGSGGRNQEVALGAARVLDGAAGALVLSAGTDGIDGPTDAAGAVVTGHTLERARRRGLDPGAALERNDAYPFFEALDDLVITGPTGTNVMDLVVGLVRAPG